MPPTPTSRKRSTARRTATEADKNTTPDTSGEQNGSAAEPDVTLTPEQRILAAIKEDHARIRNEKGEEVKDGVSFINKKIEDLRVVAKRLFRAQQTVTNLVGEMAMALLDIREAIEMPDGKPDWQGKSETYKEAAAQVIDTVWKDMPGRERTTFRNTVQRRASRMLAERIARYANKSAGLDLPEDEVLRIVSLKEEAVEGDNAKDENVKKLVKAVNDQYRVGASGDASNAADSPFVKKVTPDRGTPGTSEKNAKEAVNNSKSFKAALPNLTMEVVGPTFLDLAFAIRDKVTSDNPAHGDAGIQGTVGWLRHAAAVAHATAKELDGKTLSKDEREALEAAEKANGQVPAAEAVAA